MSKLILQVAFDVVENDNVFVEDTIEQLKDIIKEQDYGEGICGVVCKTVEVSYIEG